MVASVPRGERQAYVRRGSRMTKAQAAGYRRLANFSLADPTAPHAGFQRSGPLLVEIGFGNGAVLSEYAQSHETWNCLGIEVYRPGLGGLAKRIERLGLQNLKLLEGEALTQLEKFPLASIDMLWVFFPDPWPKKRHHKRRLFAAEFVPIVARCLVPGASIYVATDWQEYATAIQGLAWSDSGLTGGVVERPAFRTPTKFEQRGVKLGHSVTDLRYTRPRIQDLVSGV